MTDFRDTLRWVARRGRRIVVTILGFAVLLGGVVMLVTPGPGLLVIVVGLALLGTEYAWARRALDRAREKATAAAGKVRRRKRR